MSALVEAIDVHRSFGATPALRGVDLRVDSGEIVAIMGPSGSGKSTLLHCLAGILQPDHGQVRFADDRIDDLSEHDRTVLRRESFGFLFQFGQLVPELAAVENVALPLLLGGRRRREAVAEADRWFERLGIDGLQARRPGELSGGEGQRVALARALVTSPAVLFADEPTGSLDSLAGERVMDLLVDTARSNGTTVIIVTHEPRVAAYADREVVVRDGRATTSVGAR
jgi:putative ABC transport system ATP-binding protein